MPTKPGHKLLGIDVDVDFHHQYDAPRYFWKRLGKSFIALVGKITTSEYKLWAAEFPDIEQFFNEYTLEEDN